MLTIGKEGTRRVAMRLAEIAMPGDCFALRGDLGAGKTLFSQTFVGHLGGGDMAVISPTFNLLQTFSVSLEGGDVTIWHYDLYRLEDPVELEELGLDDAFDAGITLIEWPEIAAHLLPDNAINVTFDFAEDNDNRNIRVNSSDPATQARLDALALEQVEPE